MKLIEAVALAYRDALNRGELDYLAFERAAAVYRERHPDAGRARVNLEVARMIPGSLAASHPHGPSPLLARSHL